MRHIDILLQVKMIYNFLYIQNDKVEFFFLDFIGKKVVSVATHAHKVKGGECKNADVGYNYLQKGNAENIGTLKIF